MNYLNNDELKLIGILVTKGASVWDGLGKIFGKVIDRVEDVLGLLAPSGTVCMG